MTRIRRLTEVLKEHPSFKPGWRALKESSRDGDVAVGFDNPGFGRVEGVVVCDGEGRPVYDQYQIEEGPADADGKRRKASGAIIVPYYLRDGQVQLGFIVRLREVVRDPATGNQGRESLEFPRGLRNAGDSSDLATAIRELGEEMHGVAKSAERIGGVNPNTAFYVTSGIPVFSVELEPARVRRSSEDAGEHITRSEFMSLKKTFEKVARGEIFCGLTLSALALFTSRISLNGR